MSYRDTILQYADSRYPEYREIALQIHEKPETSNHEVFACGLLSEELKTAEGARIDRVQQPEKDKILLALRTREGNRRLLISASASGAGARALPHAEVITGDMQPTRPERAYPAILSRYR